MFTNQKVKLYVILFLVFCVASSKGIIIYNEETLVALSFASFVVFCFHYFGNTVKDSLNERSLTIKTELENFHKLKEESLQQLLTEHKRIGHLKQILPAVARFTEQELAYVSSSEGQAVSLHNRFNNQVKEKLGQLQLSKSSLQQRLQKGIAQTIFPLVLAKIIRQQKASGGKGVSSSLSKQVKESIARA